MSSNAAAPPISRICSKASADRVHVFSLRAAASPSRSLARHSPLLATTSVRSITRLGVSRTNPGENFNATSRSGSNHASSGSWESRCDVTIPQSGGKLLADINRLRDAIEHVRDYVNNTNCSIGLRAAERGVETATANTGIIRQFPGFRRISPCLSRQEKVQSSLAGTHNHAWIDGAPGASRFQDA